MKRMATTQRLLVQRGKAFPLRVVLFNLVAEQSLKIRESVGR